ncbi:MAG: ParB/RepB/Spo0J family partition protein [Candidatus Lambdaproteobacteria bacterium]|nr:ParB/RepB/Spo0J family partition protein [Candidatus Lambdaproteobacteria bacterium]
MAADRTGKLQSPPDRGAAADGRLAALPVERIVAGAHQPRRQFLPEQTEALARSIRSQGVIQPVIVRPHPQERGAYELVAGERRWRAVRALGWPTIPAIVRDIPEAGLLEAALVENLQREALTPIEEAQAYRTLLDGYGYTQETLARRVGKERSTVANLVRLLALPLAVQEDLESGALTIGHARALLALPEAASQLALRAAVLAEALSVRETERRVRRTLARDGAKGREGEGAAPGGHPSPLGGEGQGVGTPGRSRAGAGAALSGALQFQAVQEQLERRLGTRVAIAQGAGAQQGQGTIRIAFYSLDDFNRIYDMLMRR